MCQMILYDILSKIYNVISNFLCCFWEDNSPAIRSVLWHGMPLHNALHLHITLNNTVFSLFQLFVDNFVHGDLHPGNILVQNAESFVPQVRERKKTDWEICAFAFHKFSSKELIWLGWNSIECPLLKIYFVSRKARNKMVQLLATFLMIFWCVTEKK